MKRYRFATIIEGPPNMWWISKLNRYGTYDEVRKYGGNTASRPIRSVKAFKRFLRKHKEQLQGCEVCLVSWYEGHEVIARYKETS